MKKSKLPIKVKYIVNNKTTIAMLEGNYLNMTDYLACHTAKRINTNKIGSMLIKTSDLIGIAVCSKDDTFNSAVGMRLAEARLLKQLYSRISSELRNKNKELSIVCDEITTMQNKFIEKMTNSNEKIVRLVSETERK